MAGEIGKIPGHRRIGLPERIGAIDQRDIVEFGAADPLRLHDPEQAGVMQIAFGLRRQAPQLLGPGSAFAQLRNQRLGPGNHGRIGAVVRFRTRGQRCVRPSTNTCHVWRSSLSRRHYGSKMRLMRDAANLFETCLTGRSCLMIVYRLITNYSRRG